MKKKAIVKSLEVAKTALKKYSPQILTGIGIAGMIATTITAVKATPKALQLIDEREIKENKRLSTTEVIKTTWKCYVPAAVTGTLSVACLIGASSVSLKRHAALATAYTLSETALKEYQEKTIEVVVERKAQDIQDAVAKKQLEKSPLGGREVLVCKEGDVLCFDPLSGRYFKSDINILKKAMNDLNFRIRNEMQITLNEFYDEIGLRHTDIGEHLGWDIEQHQGCIDLQFSTQLADNGMPCVVVGHHSPPIYIW